MLQTLPRRDVVMTHFRGWMLLGGWGVALALFSGCFPAARPQPASLEQTAPDGSASTFLESTTRQQHLERLGLPRWHEHGCRGQGVKVAILDSGFRGYRDFLGKGLPQFVKARSFRFDRDLEARDSQHGILCAEVVHALAPDAELLFATWEPDSPRAFLDAVRWARTEGARIISCSLIMPGWSDGEGGGVIHQALARQLGSGYGARDVLCFASAGNTAQRHWTGEFRPDALGRHQWSGRQHANVLTPWGGERVIVELYGPEHLAYELEVFESAGGTRIGSARLGADPQQGGRAIVRFEPAAHAAYHVTLRGPRAASPHEKFHLVVLGGNLQYATAQGSIAFPGDGAAVYAVGAVDGLGQRISYSSCGPNSALPKPDFVAVVPFPSQCRDRPFAGTSAAAPQAAGLAAVLWSSQLPSTPAQIVAALRNAAEDLGPPGHDCETGYGLIRLPR
jgi:subtilisin family serine protease